MNFLVIGASGMIGKVFMDVLGGQGIARLGTYHTRRKDGLVYLDTTDAASTLRLVSQTKPEVVVQTAAQPNVDYCEDHREEVWSINVVGTENVAEACRRTGAEHVFISTDYVFDGTAGPYSENDPVNPINFYGVTKVEGEKRVQSLEKQLIIRTGWVFDAVSDSKNFALRVVNELLAGKSIRAPADQIGNPTLATNLAECVIELTMRNKIGIYNVAGRSLMSRYAFACKICETFNLDDTLVNAVTSEELNQRAKRPKRVGLKTERATRELSKELLEVDVALNKFKDKMQMESLKGP